MMEKSEAAQSPRYDEAARNKSPVREASEVALVSGDEFIKFILVTSSLQQLTRLYF